MVLSSRIAHGPLVYGSTVPWHAQDTRFSTRLALAFLFTDRYFDVAIKVCWFAIPDLYPVLTTAAYCSYNAV